MCIAHVVFGIVHVPVVMQIFVCIHSIFFEMHFYRKLKD